MVKRERYLKQIQPFIDKDLIKVITGIRRSGKSVFLQQVKEILCEDGREESQFIYMNFEDLRYEELLDYRALHKELTERIRKTEKKSYLMLDEIQKVDSWEKVINSLRVSCDCDIYITGSNSKLLSGELATELSGRYVEIQMFPFSFSEYLTSVRSNRMNLQNDFLQYLNQGGMPFLSLIYEDSAACESYLRDIYNSVVLNDIVSRYSIRDVDLLKRIIAYMGSEIGHPLTANNIVKFLKSENRKASLDTVLDYMEYCCNAYLFKRIPRENIRGKKVMRVNDKFYMMDHGIRQMILGDNQRDIDQVLENIVYLELLRRGYTVTTGLNAEKEIDFVAIRGKNKEYFQVTYLLAGEATIAREFGAYEGISDNYPKYVLSLDPINQSRDGIIHKNIVEFLLEE